MDQQLDTFIVTVGENAEKEAVRLAHELRANDIQVDKDYQGRKMKAQFKAADRLQAKHVIIIGEDELQEQVVHIRDMSNGEQVEVPLNEIVNTMKDRLSGGY